MPRTPVVLGRPHSNILGLEVDKVIGAWLILIISLTRF